jgi:hypothetical protein
MEYQTFAPTASFASVMEGFTGRGLNGEVIIPTFNTWARNEWNQDTADSRGEVDPNAPSYKIEQILILSSILSKWN